MGSYWGWDTKEKLGRSDAPYPIAAGQSHRAEGWDPIGDGAGVGLVGTDSLLDVPPNKVGDWDWYVMMEPSSTVCGKVVLRGETAKCQGATQWGTL